MSSLMTLEAPSPVPDEAVPGYWQVIGRQFYRPFMTRLALAFALVVVLCAVFVPFIANGSPYYIEMLTTKGWVARFPLFADLTDLDLTILCAFFAVVAAYFAVRWTRRVAPERRGRRRAALLTGVALLAVMFSSSLFAFRSDRLDPLDYRDLAAASTAEKPTARDAWFPPIRWGYADQEPLAADLINKPPSRRHLMGTDLVGRDTLSRLLWSTRAVLGIGLVAELISTVLGLLYGALMGYFVGAVDMLGMRFVEMVESIPTLFLIIIFVAIFGRQMALIMIIIGLTGWTGVARFVRAEFLRIRRTEFVQAAVGLGLPLRSILFRHIMPNALSSVLVVITFGIAGAIFAESTLSFLGLGLEPPLPSWGVMLNEAGNPGEIFRPWLALGPGLLIFLAIFACNIIGEGLRDALDPRLNKMQ